MVMAFAAIIALAPADKDVTAIQVYGEGKDVDEVDPTVVDSPGVYYISDDMTVKIKSMDEKEPMGESITFFVQNGKELELSIKGFYDGLTVYICSVTADQQRPTTSTVDPADVNSNGQNDNVTGKIVIMDTLASFVVDSELDVKTQKLVSVNQSVVYTAMMPYVVITETTSGSNVKTDVWTFDPLVDISKDDSKRLSSQKYATISSDSVLNAEIARFVTVAPGQALQTVAPVDMMTYGIMTDIEADGCYTYYAVGMNAGGLILEDGDSVYVMNGSATVGNHDNSSNVKLTSVKGVDVSVTGGVFTVTDLEGTKGLTAGTMTVSGKVTFDNLTDSAIVTFNSNVVASGSMKVSKTLILKNDKDGIKDLTVTGAGTIIVQ